MPSTDQRYGLINATKHLKSFGIVSLISSILIFPGIIQVKAYGASSDAANSAANSNLSNEKITNAEFAQFLWEKVINNPSKSLSVSYYSPGPDIDWQQVSLLLNNRQFDEIIKIFETRWTGPAISKHGIPNLWNADEFGFEASDLAILNQFCTQYSKSPWPFLFRAEFYNWYAWEARGDGYASTVTQKGRQLMGERLTKAFSDYQIVAQLCPKFTYAYAGAGYVAMIAGRQRTAFQQYQKALALDPANWNALNSLFDHSQSKWYGTDNNLMFEFARAIAEKHPEYPYLARLVVKAHEEMARLCSQHAANGDKAYLNQPKVWNEIITIYKKLLAQYPESKFVRKYLSNIANQAGKQAEIGDLLW